MVLLWHLHQPEYRDRETGRVLAPWTYLHALKDYSDMAAHLELQPAARACFNLTPVLLEQIEAYVPGLVADRPCGDALLDALLPDGLPSQPSARRALVAECLRAQRQRMVERHAPFAGLVAIAEAALAAPGGLAYLGQDFVADLVVWYHLAWTGEALRRTLPLHGELLARGSPFGTGERLALRRAIGAVLAGLMGRYRALSEAARVELISSPYTHPILPLLVDFGSARQARSGLALPRHPRYPGGRERALVQLVEGREQAARVFGRAPSGCWPSEGAICAESLQLAAEAGYRWLASGAAVLAHSLGAGALDSEALHRPWRLVEGGPVLFFRDDGLSDRIGFEYKDWAPADAVGDLLARLENIAASGGPGRVVLIALDGENAWEHYPENGWAFLSGLYRALAEHPQLELTTPSACLESPEVEVRSLHRLVAGSWVFGDLATWIGHPDKNQAWDWLVEAKQVFDARAEPSPAARAQLAVCEGSDWFWWPGDYNPPQIVAEFEALYRHHLATLYQCLGQPVPNALSRPFSHGHGPGDGLAVLRPPRQ